MGLGSPRTRTLMLTSCPSSTDWSDRDTWGSRGQKAASTHLHPGPCLPTAAPRAMCPVSQQQPWSTRRARRIGGCPPARSCPHQGVGRPDPAAPGTVDHRLWSQGTTPLLPDPRQLSAHLKGGCSLESALWGAMGSPMLCSGLQLHGRSVLGGAGLRELFQGAQVLLIRGDGAGLAEGGRQVPMPLHGGG